MQHRVHDKNEFAYAARLEKLAGMVSTIVAQREHDPNFGGGRAELIVANELAQIAIESIRFWGNDDGGIPIILVREVCAKRKIDDFDEWGRR